MWLIVIDKINSQLYPQEIFTEKTKNEAEVFKDLTSTHLGNSLVKWDKALQFVTSFVSGVSKKMWDQQHFKIDETNKETGDIISDKSKQMMTCTHMKSEM